MRLLIIAISLCIVPFLNACSPSKNEAKNETKVKTEIQHSNLTTQNLNVSVFVDLSDRICPKLHPNPSMEYYQRDLGYINSVVSAFQSHILSKRINLMDDNIQVFVDPLPSNPEINRLINDLRCHFSKKNVTKEKIQSLNKKYINSTKELYELAIRDNDFIGSDIWGFFKNKIQEYCIKEKHRNIFVILTDGYAYHKDNVFNLKNRTSYLTPRKVTKLGLTDATWKQKMEQSDCGFIHNNINLADLEVLVLGINGYKKTPFEEDVIREYWKKWFKEMGIKRYSIKTADIPTNLDGVIKDFILKK